MSVIPVEPEDVAGVVVVVVTAAEEASDSVVPEQMADLGLEPVVGMEAPS
jgi:hypothetical protein